MSRLRLSWLGSLALLLAGMACRSEGDVSASVLSCTGPVAVSEEDTAAMVKAMRETLPVGRGERLVIYTPFIQGGVGSRRLLEEVVLVEREDGSRELRQYRVVAVRDGKRYRVEERTQQEVRPFRGEGCPLEGIAAPRGDERVSYSCSDGSHSFSAMVVAQRLDAPQATLPAAEGAALEEAYRRYWCTTSQAYRSLSPEGLQEVATGDELARLAFEIGGRRREAAALEERVEHQRVTLLQYTGQTAVVDSWATFTFRSGSGEWSAPESALFSVRLVKGEDGRWRVERVRRLPAAREAP